LVFVFGILNFADAPYKPSGSDGGYCGKFGKPHTKSEYNKLKDWEATLFISWPFGIISAFVLNQHRKANKNTGKSLLKRD